MKLTEEQKLKLQQNLKGKGICSNCGFDGGIEPLNAQFQLQSPVINNRVIDLNSPVNSWPVIAVRCPKCGLISLFDANFLDI
jgi:hypothetical protein